MAAVSLCIATAHRARQLERIIDKQFFAGGDGPDRLNKKNTVGLLDGFTVRVAGMVQPAGAVAPAIAVDHAAVGKTEQERVSFVFARGAMVCRLAPARH